MAEVHVLITGAGGMLGQKLAARLAKEGSLGGREVSALTLADIVEAPAPVGFAGRITTVVADLAEPGAAERLIGTRPGIIFHLAAIVSGEAEADFEKGYRVNFDGARCLFEAIRQEGAKAPYHPRFVFASSVAVFGGPMPEVLSDDFLVSPETSYGTQKAIVELLLADYSRRGFFDGIGIRLPTICVRPGKPNRAASGFFSSILREPLSGHEAVLPVPTSVRHWFASPRAAVGFLIHAASVDLLPLGTRRNLNLPGLSASVGEQIEALRRVAGESAVKRIRIEADPDILRIIQGWPRAFDARRAEAVGFRAERSMDEIISVFIEDERGGAIAW